MKRSATMSGSWSKSFAGWTGLILGFALACAIPVCAQNTGNIPARQDYSQLVKTLRPFIEREMATKGIPGMSVAIVDKQEIVWAQGFGMADAKNKIPASAETVYRIGSVSKLFTDIGIMQKVERGEIDLDASVSEYLPEFRPKNAFGAPITLRELMSHRSGLLREPPVGNYFETTEPSLAATVKSLNETELV